MPHHNPRTQPRRGARLLGACVGLLMVVGAPIAGGAAAAGSSPTLAPPPVPKTGGYLGAFVDPSGKEDAGNAGALSSTVLANENTRELAELGTFDASIGRPLTIVHVYEKWGPASDLVSNATLDAIAGEGGVPMIAWNCGATLVKGVPTGATDAAIAAGTYDSYIEAYAQQLKAYGGPLFLRWYREPNLSLSANWTACGGGQTSTSPTCASAGANQTAAANYVAAWQRIYDDFQSVGATNVSFVWNPGLGGDANASWLSCLWPGTKYVNWIGIDGYSRPPADQSFTQIYGTPALPGPYQVLTAPLYGGLPIMTAETGAVGSNQQAYLQSVSTALNSVPAVYPDIHAFMYFDSTNDECGTKGGCDWALAGSGLTTLATFAQSAFFQPTF